MNTPMILAIAPADTTPMSAENANSARARKSQIERLGHCIEMRTLLPKELKSSPQYDELTVKWCRIGAKVLATQTQAQKQKATEWG